MKKISIKIGFCGGGNMATAIISSLIEKKIFLPKEIGVFEPDSKRAGLLVRKLKIQTRPSNAAIVSSAKTVILAVKPQQMNAVLTECKSVWPRTSLAVSIAAGLDTQFFSKHLPQHVSLVRVMPNLGLMFGVGATGIYGGPKATPQQIRLVQKIFSAGGICVKVTQESDLDIITALSGSGPAFSFSFIDALMSGAEKQGLSPHLCRTLALQTIKGAVAILEQSGEPAEAWITRVASKGGTTEAGLKVMTEHHIKDILHKTIEAATERAEELCRQS